MSSAAYINGKYLPGDGPELVVQDPSDESIVAAFPGASLEQVEAAILSSRQAYDGGEWRKRKVADRAMIMRRYVAALVAQGQRLGELAVREAGCPVNSSVMRAQVDTPLRQAAEIIDLFLTLPEIEENAIPLHERISPMGSVVQSLKRYTPLGVVAALPANNVPFFTAMWKVIPALMAGNAVVLRPNPLTPLSAMVFAQAAEAAHLPPGLLNVVLDAGHEGGRLLSSHEDVDMVAFTGSSSVGAAVMAQAAPTLKRLQLELGGKSAQVFLPDSAEKAVQHALIVCTSHAGQGCTLGTRLFVPEDRKAEVLEMAAAGLAAIRIGPAGDPQTQTGPLVSAAQRERCERYVALAEEHGGRVVVGGKRPSHLDRGFYFEPTLLDLPDNRNPAAQDEIFGPIVAIIGYRDLDDAVAMANDSRFGLSGYVHGLDRRAALQVALGIRSGTVHCNGTLSSAYVPFGGQRMSGFGIERGIEGLREFQQMGCLTLG